MDDMLKNCVTNASLSKIGVGQQAVNGLKQELKRLGQDHLNFFLLSAYDGFSKHEIMAILNVSEKRYDEMNGAVQHIFNKHKEKLNGKNQL